jgi:dihydroorotase-like cyclic amidohydrolase
VHSTPTSARGSVASRPRGAENLAIAWLLERARWTGARTHVLHLSSSDALPMLASARRDGVAVTVETCPHGQVRETWLRGEPVDLDVPRGELLVRE